MSRSLKKGPYVNEKLLKKLSNMKMGDKKVVKTWDRACTITPEMLGFTIGVHNGKIHVPVHPRAARKEHGGFQGPVPFHRRADD